MHVGRSLSSVGRKKGSQPITAIPKSCTGNLPTRFWGLPHFNLSFFFFVFFLLTPYGMYLCPVPFPTSPHLPCFSVFPASQVKSDGWVGCLPSRTLTCSLLQNNYIKLNEPSRMSLPRIARGAYSKDKGVMCLSVYISVWEGGGRAQAAWTRIPT